MSNRALPTLAPPLPWSYCTTAPGPWRRRPTLARRWLPANTPPQETARTGELRRQSRLLQQASGEAETCCNMLQLIDLGEALGAIALESTFRTSPQKTGMFRDSFSNHPIETPPEPF